MHLSDILLHFILQWMSMNKNGNKMLTSANGALLLSHVLICHIFLMKNFSANHLNRIRNDVLCTYIFM